MMAEYRGSKVSLLSTTYTLLFILTSSISVVSGQTTGVYLSLYGVTIPNDGYVLANDIGSYSTGLHCNTDRSNCCRGSDHPSGTAQGHWYLPNGTEVMSFTAQDRRPEPNNFFFRNRVTGIVLLNRYGIPPMEDRGRFRCEVPDASGVTVTLYVNIVDGIPTTRPPMGTTDQLPQPLTTRSQSVSITVASITASGINTAGAIYSLVCSVSVTGSSDQPNIIWLDPINRRITSGVETTGSMSTLTFNPLVASHAGTYMCRATLDGTTRSQAFPITVNVVNVQVTPSSTTSPLSTGSSDFTLSCDVSGTGNLNLPTITYQWRRESSIISGQQGRTLTLSPLSASHAGRYVCQATVASSSLSSVITVTSGNQTVNIQLPPPASVSITSDPLSPVNHLSAVTVTCTVELDSAILESDLSLVMVSTQLNHPNGTSLSNSVMRSGTTFIYTTQLNSFKRTDSGSYTCTATVRPQQMATFVIGSGSLTSTAEITVRVTVKVNFQFIASVDPKDINFSLTCNSTGGTAESVVWTRDGFFLHNTGPLVLTDASTLSYTNVLRVSDRTPGTYMCTIRGPNDQILSSTNFTVQASAPPVDVVATQSSSFAPVEVSWSPPSDGANIITGYGIFYGNRQNLFSSYVTRIVLESSQIESVSIRSESVQLPSELIRVTVTIAGEQSSEALCTRSSEVGIAVGVLLLVEGVIAGVITIIVVSCWIVTRQRKLGKSDFTVSANMAYGQVKLDTLGNVGGEYEDPDRLARSGQSDGGNYEPTRHPAPYELPVGKPEAPVYATADESAISRKTPS